MAFPAGRSAVGDDTAFDEVLGQRGDSDREVLGHGQAGLGCVAPLERGDDATMVAGRLLRPSGQRREDRLGRVSRDAGHELGELGRAGRHVDQAVELVVELHGPLQIATTIGLFQLVLNGPQFRELFLGDGLGSPGGELATDECLHVGHVGDVAGGQLQHHEPTARLLYQQPLGAQVQQRLAHRRHADAQFDRKLVEPQVFARAERPIEDPPSDVARDVVGQLRSGREGRVRVDTHAADSC